MGTAMKKKPPGRLDRMFKPTLKLQVVNLSANELGNHFWFKMLQ